MDMCHAGHINLLKNMKKVGDRVVVVLHDDSSCYKIKNKIPIQNTSQRVSNLWITELVDEVWVTYSTDPSDEFEAIISKYEDDYRLLFMRADDNLDYPGRHTIDDHKIPTVFIPYTKGVSSSQLREKLQCGWPY